MKKIQFLLAIMIMANITVSAQYKKASFLSKAGRTYALGVTAHNLGDGKGSPLGYSFSSGSDNTAKHFFHWYEIVAIPPFKYSYETTYHDGNTDQDVPATVSGKSKFHLIYDYNMGYHLLNRKRDKEPTLQPYLFLGFNIVVFGKADEPEIPNYYDYKKKVSTSGLSFGARGGLGLVFRITDRIGIKTDLGYDYQYNWSADDYYDSEMYHMFTNHAFVNAGLRFRFLQD